MIIIYVIIGMGSGQSQYIEDQERFVHENCKKFKDVLNTPNSRFIDYKYNDAQVKGKLRQMYHKTDEKKENRTSYINSERWIDAKKKLNYISYSYQ